MKFWLLTLMTVFSFAVFTNQVSATAPRKVIVQQSIGYSNNVFGVSNYGFNRIAYTPVAVVNYQAPVVVANYGYQVPVAVAAPICVQQQVYQAPAAPICVQQQVYQAPVATFAAPVYSYSSVGVGVNNYFGNISAVHKVNTFVVNKAVASKIVVANHCK